MKKIFILSLAFLIILSISVSAIVPLGVSYHPTLYTNFIKSSTSEGAVIVDAEIFNIGPNCMGKLQLGDDSWIYDDSCDTSTGNGNNVNTLHIDSDDTIEIKSNDNLGIHINTIGKVGIKEQYPLYDLDVDGTIRAQGKVVTPQVGIGTNTPISKLDIIGTGGANSYFDYSSTGVCIEPEVTRACEDFSSSNCDSGCSLELASCTANKKSCNTEDRCEECCSGGYFGPCWWGVDACYKFYGPNPPYIDCSDTYYQVYCYVSGSSCVPNKPNCINSCTEHNNCEGTPNPCSSHSGQTSCAEHNCIWQPSNSYSARFDKAVLLNKGLKIDYPINNYLHNSFNNDIAFYDLHGNAAISFNEGVAGEELMFGFHSNGKFYWADEDEYLLSLDSITKTLQVYGKISGVQTPTSNTDAANKQYVDNAVGVGTTSAKCPRFSVDSNTNRRGRLTWADGDSTLLYDGVVTTSGLRVQDGDSSPTNGKLIWVECTENDDGSITFSRPRIYDGNTDESAMYACPPTSTQGDYLACKNPDANWDSYNDIMRFHAVNVYTGDAFCAEFGLDYVSRTAAEYLIGYKYVPATNEWTEGSTPDYTIVDIICELP